MKIAISGVKPTGRPHIGNYFGAMKQFVELQDSPEFADAHHYVFIADYHALNFIQNGEEMRQNILDLAIDYLAIGLDPKKVILFKQSDIPAHTELCWIFDTLTTMPYLMRAHAYKDAEAKNKEISVGTFNYPMLMAADILIHQATIVPVGQDQKQHVEYARDTAEKFNRIYGETFVLPKEYIISDVAIVPGTDGRKMSKSYGNTISLFAEDDEIRKAVMSIPTDSKAPDEPKDPDSSFIFAINKLFLNKSEEKELAEQYRAGIGYKYAKERLIEDIIKFIAPLREKRKEIAANPEKVMKILEEGGLRAKLHAEKTMEKVRKAIGVS